MAFDSMRDFLARHVMKRVNVYRIDDFNMDPPELHKLKQRVDTYSIKPDIKLNVTKPFDFDKKMTCKATRLDFAALENVKSKKYKLKRFTKQDVKTHKLLLNKKIRTWKLLKQIQALPQERQNMLKFQKKRKIGRAHV